MLGKEANDWIEVKSGISANTEVVSVGAFDLMSAITASGRSAAHGH
jgi:cobalt-zinc-cadmium efflux system membrane fusion protein